MITGIGTDLVEVARFRSVMSRRGERFLEKVFTSGERKYCEEKMHRLAHYTARFAAKEAVLKSLGTGWSGGIHWTDIEILHQKNGAVGVKLAGLAAKIAKERKVKRVVLSISHSRKYASALAVAES